MIRKWLKAELVDKGEFSPTEQGTPQGGGISPLLLNVALHGMEEAVESAISSPPKLTA
jgi:RNA-directed DNA polymerase